jgi:hypothetical protein
MTSSKSNQSARLVARAKWDIAVERMGLELDPPTTPPFGPHDLPAAIAQVDAALAAIRQAYGVGEG